LHLEGGLSAEARRKPSFEMQVEMQVCVAHLEGVLSKSISATAERGSVSRSTFNRPKTHGISCARSESELLRVADPRSVPCGRDLVPWQQCPDPRSPVAPDVAADVSRR
jgi:hypothetical protein